MSHQTIQDPSVEATLNGLVRLSLVLLAAPAVLVAALAASLVTVVVWPLAYVVRRIGFLSMFSSRRARPLLPAL